MRYHYLHPLKPQYFFPEGYCKHPLFKTFFQPYSLFGKLSWWLFRHCNLFRFIFSKSNIENYIPVSKIKKQLPPNSILAFNRGTVGPEQKITALGISGNETFFIKYAQTPLAVKNVNNEHTTLKQLQHFNFVPKVLGFSTDAHTALLKTSILEGKRFKATSLNNSILNILFKLAETTITGNMQSSAVIKMCFAHGDFCPWNMMDNQGKILVFDWEMAKTYTLGYDLFTYLFQTAFLLQPNYNCERIIEENRENIQRYFNHFAIPNWKPYLLEFAKIKTALESKKNKNDLFAHYQNLRTYAEKA